MLYSTISFFTLEFFNALFNVHSMSLSRFIFSVSNNKYSRVTLHAQVVTTSVVGLMDIYAELFVCSEKNCTMTWTVAFHILMRRS